MNYFTQAKRKKEEKASKKRERANSDLSADQVEPSPDKGKESSRTLYDSLDRAKSSSIIAEGNYQASSDKFNESVDTFNENFIPVMTKIQEND
jgi:hypothetical protein